MLTPLFNEKHVNSANQMFIAMFSVLLGMPRAIFIFVLWFVLALNSYFKSNVKLENSRVERGNSTIGDRLESIKELVVTQDAALAH